MAAETRYCLFQVCNPLEECFSYYAFERNQNNVVQQTCFYLTGEVVYTDAYRGGDVIGCVC